MSIIPKRTPKPLVRGYRADDTLVDGTPIDSDDAQPGSLDERYLSEAKRSNDLLEESMHLRRVEVGSRHTNPDGTYSLGSYISGESSVRAGVKTLADSETLERNARQLADTYGYRGEQLDAFVTAENWFKAATIAQLPRHKGHAAAQRRMDAFESIQKADMSEGTTTGGGYAVPSLVGNEVLRLVRDASDIYAAARKIPMSSNVLAFPDENTAVTVNWVAEAGTLTGGEPVFGVKTLTAKKIAGRAVFSLELIDDANVQIVPFLSSCFSEKIGGELDFQAMEGPGTVFTGVQGAVSVSDCARTNGTNGVVLSYSSSTATIAAITKLFTLAGESSARKSGSFVMGPGVYSKLIGLVDTNNQPIVRLGAVSSAPEGTLLGRPIIVSNRLTTYTVGAGTVSVGSMYFGPTTALLFGVNTNFRWDVTDQVHWGTYQADARMIGRFGYVVGVPSAWSKQTGIIV